MSAKSSSPLAAVTVERRTDPEPILVQAERILAEAAAPPKNPPPDESPAAAETPADESQPPPDDKPEKLTVKAAAERLGLDPAKLYEDLTVAFDDGTALTVAELKNSYKPVAEMTKARASLTEEMVTSRQEVNTARQELAHLVSLLGNTNVPAEMIREVGRLAEQSRQAESEKLLKAIPEWKDPITRAAEWSDIKRIAGEYGYSEADIRLAEQGYADHRLLKMARALAKAPKPESPKPAPKVAVKPVAGKDQTQAQQFGQLKAKVTKGLMRPEDAGALVIQGKA